MRKHYKMMTEADYDNIKLLLKAKLSTAQIKNVTSRSYSTIRYINISESYEGYKALLKAAMDKSIAKKARAESIVTTTPMPANVYSYNVVKLADSEIVKAKTLADVCATLEEILKEIKGARADMRNTKDARVRGLFSR